ncbi:MAG: hypothetical protein NWS47_00465 [Alphaproteobacteria bacterium]|nr:hypothetical protein [Alphaproteobacteria bacterium]
MLEILSLLKMIFLAQILVAVYQYTKRLYKKIKSTWSLRRKSEINSVCENIQHTLPFVDDDNRINDDHSFNTGNKCHSLSNLYNLVNSLEADITETTELDFSVFQNVRDIDLMHITSLGNLLKIDLTGCRNITDAGLLHIAKLTNLKELYLRDTAITDIGLKYLIDCKSLTKLDLRDLRISHISLGYLKDFHNLSSLHFNFDSEIVGTRGLLELKNIINLTDLSLHYYYPDDEEINILNNTINIKSIIIYNYGISDQSIEDLFSFSKLNKFIKLHVTCNDNSFNGDKITDTGIKHLCNLPNIYELVFDHTSITNDGLAFIAQIKTLNSLVLGECFDITRKGLSVLANLSNLTRLEFYVCGSNDNGDSLLTKLKAYIFGSADSDYSPHNDLMFLKELKNLHELCFFWTLVSDDDCKFVISDLNSLRVLSLNCDLISDLGVQSITKLDNLTDLSLADSSITDKSLEYIGELKNLVSLSLSNTSVTNLAIPYILNMTNLKILNLTNTRISTESIILIKNCLKNTKVIH